MKNQNQDKPAKTNKQQKQEKPKTPEGDSANTNLSKPEQEPPVKPQERTEGIP